MPRIMVVDDNEEHLRCIKLALSMIKNVKVDTFLNGAKALEKAKKKQYDAVVSDFCMPDMDGISFLKAFRSLQPATKRIMVSATCERSSLFGAINEARVHRFIEKPYHLESLGYIVEETIREPY